jgi:hypothetical protein
LLKHIVFGILALVVHSPCVLRLGLPAVGEYRHVLLPIFSGWRNILVDYVHDAIPIKKTIQLEQEIQKKNTVHYSKSRYGKAMFFLKRFFYKRML